MTDCRKSQRVSTSSSHLKAELVLIACLQGTRGRLLQVPVFAQPPSSTEGGAAPPAPFLVSWEVDAEQGTGPVLLLARAAHCLHQLHVMNAGRQAVAGTEPWQVSGAIQ